MKESLLKVGSAIPDEIADGRCPICEEHAKVLDHYKKHKDDMAEDDRKKAYEKVRAYHPFSGGFTDPKPKRWFLWVVDAIDQDAEEEGVKFYLAPNKVYEDGIIDLSWDYDVEDEDGNPEYVDLVDPKKGHVFMFKRKGKEWHETDYLSFRTKPRGWDISDWLEDRPSVFRILKFHSYEEIAEAMGAVDDADDADDVDDIGDIDDGDRESYSGDGIRDDLERVYRRRGATAKDGDEKDERDKKDEDAQEAPRRRRRRPAEPKAEDEPPVPEGDSEPNPYEDDQEDQEDREDDDISDEVREIRRRVRERKNARKDAKNAKNEEL